MPVTTTCAKCSRSRRATRSCCSKRGLTGQRPNATQIIWEHGRRNFALRADGMLAIVCPIFDDSPGCGIGIFNAQEDVARMMDDDPGVRAGIFEYEVHPARGFPGSSLPA